MALDFVVYVEGNTGDGDVEQEVCVEGYVKEEESYFSAEILP